MRGGVRRCIADDCVAIVTCNLVFYAQSASTVAMVMEEIISSIQDAAFSRK